MAKNYRMSITRPTDPQVITAQVQAGRQLSPNMWRLTLAGPQLRKFTYLGYDQWFRLFIAKDGQETLTLPTKTNALWYAQYLLTAKEKRPTVRNYTVRAWREGDQDADPQIDIDVVTHGDHAGPGGEFAVSAEPGTTVGLLDQGLTYEPDRPESWQLLVSDESGLPALAGIIDGYPQQARAEVFIEVPTLEDAQELNAPPGVQIHWLARKDHQQVPGVLVKSTVESATLPQAPPYAFIVGEQALVTGLRRHLVNDRGIPKNNITFVGYWRHGKAAP